MKWLWYVVLVGVSFGAGVNFTKRRTIVIYRDSSIARDLARRVNNVAGPADRPYMGSDRPRPANETKEERVKRQWKELYPKGAGIGGQKPVGWDPQ